MSAVAECRTQPYLASRTFSPLWTIRLPWSTAGASWSNLSRRANLLIPRYRATSCNASRPACRCSHNSGTGSPQKSRASGQDSSDLDALTSVTSSHADPKVGRIQAPEDRDVRWSVFDHPAIERKVDKVMTTHRYLGFETGGVPLSQHVRRTKLVGTFRAILRAASLDNLLSAPPTLPKQFAVFALLKNESAKGLLVSFVRSFTMAYARPATSQSATVALEGIAQPGRKAVMSMPDLRKFAWKALPAFAPAIRGT